jgi:hypothetical protein
MTATATTIRADEHTPRTCPYGHRLTAGLVLVGWHWCQCTEAINHHRGHRTHQCLTCVDYRITSVCYTPACLQGGHPPRRPDVAAPA